MNTTVVWRNERLKVKIGRKTRTFDVLVSSAAPGVVLKCGEWVDTSDPEAKTFDIKVGWKPITADGRHSIGPVLYDFEDAEEFAVEASRMHDWMSNEPVPVLVAISLYRMWWAALDKPIPEDVRAKFDKAEAEALAAQERAA